MKLFLNLASLLLFIYLSIADKPLNAQQSDTIFYNTSWQICEQPFAQYYRKGRINMDARWFYTGPVQDFYLSKQVQMNGRYSSTGTKEGKFYFFYDDGTLLANGGYEENKRVGIWEYYYPNGSLQARVRFGTYETEFVILDYIDPKGEIKTKDSTGTFSLNLVNNNDIVFRVSGEFKKGKKTGTWEFFMGDNADILTLREFYKDDNFQRGQSYTSRGGISMTYKELRSIYVIPEFNKFRVTEGFRKDRTSFRDATDIDLRDYLLLGKEPEFKLDTSTGLSSYLGVLRTLNTPQVVRHFRDFEKTYSGEAYFIVGDSGIVKDVEINGNLSEEEKRVMLFFLKKFKTVHDIVSDETEWNAEHKLYFFTAFEKDVLPVSMRGKPGSKTFMFSPWPYKAFAERVKTILKKSLKN